MTDAIAKINEAIRKWREVDSKRMIFGIHMPQTKAAIESLHRCLQDAFQFTPALSLVQKDQKIEVVATANPAEKSGTPPLSVEVKVHSLPTLFERFKINSLTLDAGLEKEELLKLFEGLSISLEDADKDDGLKGFLRSAGVTHIKVDQMKFRLLKDEELVGGSEGSGKGGKGKSGSGDLAGVSDKEKKARQKMAQTVWTGFFTGNLDKQALQSQYRHIITEAKEKPEELIRTLKKLAGKQKEVEKFLAHLEEELFDLGFPEEIVNNLRKKLSAPKRVLVAEDELARLKKLDQLQQKEGNLDKRADDSVEAVGRLRRKLSDERERSEAILHQMGTGGLVLDSDGNIVAMNSIAEKVLGIANKDVKGKEIKDILQKQHMLSMVNNWDTETDEFTPKEIKIQGMDKETLDIIRESAVVVEDQSGRTVGVISALQSATQHEELERRKNDILDVLGHDLRAPICAIKQNFSMLVDATHLSEQVDERQERFLNSCKRNIERMEKLIEKILDLRQFEVGKIILKYDTIQINELITDGATSLNSWADNKNIKIHLEIEDMRIIHCDAERIYQVITNLVSNALKFTPENGEIRVHQRTVSVEGKPFVEVSVQDSGIGISQEDLAKIFHKYEQVSLKSPEGVSGLGLGLAICKSIVELHGGSIWAQSGKEAGSIFIFQIPIAQNTGEP